MLHKNHPVTLNVLLTPPSINSYYTRVTHMITQVFPVYIYNLSCLCPLEPRNLPIYPLTIQYRSHRYLIQIPSLGRSTSVAAANPDSHLHSRCVATFLCITTQPLGRSTSVAAASLPDIYILPRRQAALSTTTPAGAPKRGNRLAR